MKKACLTVLALVLTMAATATAAEFSADMITVMAGTKDTGKIYFKPPNISRNEAMGMVIITNPPHVYHLFPQDKKYVMTDMEEAKQQNPMAGAEDFEEWVEINDLSKVGTEKIEGFRCDVYEGEVSFIENQPPVFMKFWYSKKLKYPIKSQTILQAPMGKVTNRLENIVIGSQPDSLFEIPSGFTREENLQKAMMGGGFQPPAGQAQGQAPSQEEMDKMMRDLQEMMKNKQKP